MRARQIIATTIAVAALSSVALAGASAAPAAHDCRSAAGYLLCAAQDEAANGAGLAGRLAGTAGELVRAIQDPQHG